MKDRRARLISRIRDELAELDRVIERVTEGWRRSKQSSDDYYVDGVALNLHGLYAGLERLFELIANDVDGQVPGGENWHQALLKQMVAEIPKVRPAVISETVRQRLEEYRGFRHVVRNVYTFKLDPTRMAKLVEETPKLFPQVRAELLAFANFLETLAQADAGEE